VQCTCARYLLAAAALAAGCTVSAAAVAADNYYRWRDAGGTLIVSDRPPPAGVPYETVAARTGRVVRAPSAAAGDDDGSAGAGNDAVRNPETCRVARDNLHALQTTDAVRTLGADGEYHYLSEEEKRMQIERAKALIRVHCRPQQREENGS
jgi:hypothetical protein